MRTSKLVAAIILVGMTTTMATAETSTPSGSANNTQGRSSALTPSFANGLPSGPPPQAIVACSEKINGEECSFIDHAQTITGTCSALIVSGPNASDDQSNLPLLCRPEQSEP